jgi:hypothetical protein
MITTSHVLKPKIMKKFLIISFLFSLFTSLTSNACGPMAPIHNYYMFNVYPHIGNDLYGDQLSDFWKSYTGENRTNEQIRKEFYQTPSEYYFSDNCGRIFATAKRKQDHEMMAYIRHLINYNKICDQLKETWDYPTKQQLAARRTTLLNMQRATKAYRGKRLSQQYALLYMRANMLLGAYNINTSYWTGVASKFSKSVYRDMMQGIYANALLHKGMWRQACDIYASQGDWNSIGWAMRKYRKRFCEEMLRLQSQYTLAGDDNSRRQAAYTLASRYYQASCYQQDEHRLANDAKEFVCQRLCQQQTSAMELDI